MVRVKLVLLSSVLVQVVQMLIGALPQTPRYLRQDDDPILFSAALDEKAGINPAAESISDNPLPFRPVSRHGQKHVGHVPVAKCNAVDRERFPDQSVVQFPVRGREN